MSGMDDGIQQQRCPAPLPHKVAAEAIAPRREQEAGPSEDSATTTVTRWEEVYTSICEHQGRLMDSPLQRREQEEPDISMSPHVSG